MKRLLCVALALAFVANAGVLFASGGKEAAGGASVDLYAWGAAGAAGDPVEKIFVQTTNDFNQKSGTAKVNMNWVANQYYEKLNTMIAAGNVPDLYTVHAAGKLADYVNSGKAVAFDQYLNADAAWKNRFPDGAFALLSPGGKPYAIPWYSAAVPLYYSTELFAQYKLDPPATWDAFLKAIKTLNANKIAPIAMGAGQNSAWVPALFMEVVAQRMGGVGPYQQILDRKGNWSFADASFVKAGQLMQQLVAMNAFNSDFLSVGADAAASMFKTKMAGMYLMGSWAVSQFESPDSLVKDKVGVVNFPAVPEGTGDLNVWLGQPSLNIAMSPKNKNPALSIAYLKAWTSEPVEKALAETAGQIPSTKVTLDQSKVPAVALATNELTKKMTGMFIFYDVGLGTDIGNEFNNAVVAILSGKDVAQTLQALQAYAKSK